jgi:hypothetical protein
MERPRAHVAVKVAQIRIVGDGFVTADQFMQAASRSVRLVLPAPMLPPATNNLECLAIALRHLT